MGTMAHEQIHGGIVRAGTPGVSLQVILGFLAIGLPEALLGASWPAMGAGVHAPLVAVGLRCWGSHSHRIIGCCSYSRYRMALDRACLWWR